MRKFKVGCAAALCAVFSVLAVSCSGSDNSNDEPDVPDTPDVPGGNGPRLLEVGDLLYDLRYDAKGRIISFKSDLYVYDVAYSASQIVVTQRTEDWDGDYSYKYTYTLENGLITKCMHYNESYTREWDMSYDNQGRLIKYSVRDEDSGEYGWREISCVYSQQGDLINYLERYRGSVSRYSVEYTDIATFTGLNYAYSPLWLDDDEAILAIQGYFGKLPDRLIGKITCTDEYGNSLVYSYGYVMNDNGTVRSCNGRYFKWE